MRIVTGQHASLAAQRRGYLSLFYLDTTPFKSYVWVLSSLALPKNMKNVGHAAVESRLGNSPRVAALRWSVSDHLVCGGYLAT